MNFFTYVIKNIEGKIYIGQTTDIERRLVEHNEEGNGYTSKFRPWELIVLESYLSRKESMARERYLKTGAGRDWIKNKISGG